MSNEDKYCFSGELAGNSYSSFSSGTASNNSEVCAENDPKTELRRKADGFLSNIRAEARRIVEDACRQVNVLKNETTLTLQKERELLERRAAELDQARRTLEEDVVALEKRQAALESETFEQARNEGYQEGVKNGLKDGYAEGEKKARDEFETLLIQSVDKKVKDVSETALAPLRALIREMSESRQALLKNWEENIMQIAAAIAYQTILREPAVMREAPLDLLREALELAMNCATLKIRMNPDDVKLLKEQIDLILEETGNLARSEVVADRKITRGGCLVETSLGVVDERLESRLERIVSELSD